MSSTISTYFLLLCAVTRQGFLWWVSELHYFKNHFVGSSAKVRKSDVLLQESNGQLSNLEGIAFEPVELIGQVNSSIYVSLAPESVLKITIELPRHARANLVEAVRYKLLAESPVDIDDAYFAIDTAHIQKNGDTLSIEVLVCFRDKVDTILKKLESYGALSIIVGFSDSQRLPFLFVLKTSHQESPLSKKIKAVSIYFLSFLLVVFSVVIGVNYLAYKMTTESRAEIERIKSKQATLEEKYRQYNSIQNAYDAIKVEIEGPKLTGIFNDLAKAIPHDSWLQTLKYDRKKISVTGLSPQAMSLVEYLNQSSYLTHVKIDSVTNRARYKLSHIKPVTFQISALILNQEG